MLNKVALTETQIKQEYLLTHGKCASTFSKNNSSVLGNLRIPREFPEYNHLKQ